MSAWAELGIQVSASGGDKIYAQTVIGLFKERSKKISEIAEKSRYFFCDPERI